MALSIDQLPVPVQPVSGADVLPVVQTETGGSTPGAKVTVQVPISVILGTFGTSGPGFTNATINGSGHLILTRTDSTTLDLGVAKGANGTTVTAVGFNNANHIIFTLSDFTSVDAGALPSVDMTSLLPGPMAATAIFYGSNSTLDGAWTAPILTTYLRSVLQPYRSVSAVNDTPLLADNRGIVGYTSSSATTVTVNDLGAGVSYQVQQQGTGQVTIIAGSAVTLAADHVSPTYKTAARWALLQVVCTGTGTVSVTGNML